MEFKESCNCDFETECSLWNFSSVSVGININTDEDYDIEDYSEKIEECINWLNKKRHIIEQAILDNNMTESAEYWVSAADKSDDGKYMLNDGNKVSLPISDDDFCKSLRLPELSLNFEDDGNCDMELYFICNPDYFAGHCIEIIIDNEKNIVCDGLSG